MLPTIAREDDVVVMIDQRKLPAQEVYVRCKTAAEVARAIKTMVIRGAPAIGVAAAMGIALGMRKSKATGTQKYAYISDVAQFRRELPIQSIVGPGIEDLLAAIDEDLVVIAADCFVGSVPFPERAGNFRGVQNIPKAEDDGRSVAPPLQHLERGQ